MLSNSNLTIMEIKRIFDHEHIKSIEHYPFGKTKEDIRELVKDSLISNMLIEFTRSKLESYK